MREILFRAKEKNGDWVWGDFITVTPRSEELCCIKDHTFLRQSHVCDRNTVGQYTGLTDKNGKKIFEGDILDTPNGKWLIVAVRGGFGFVRRKFMTEYDAKYGFHQALADPQNTVYTEENAVVIGNIYDNPELLEVSE